MTAPAWHQQPDGYLRQQGQLACHQVVSDRVARTMAGGEPKAITTELRKQLQAIPASATDDQVAAMAADVASRH